MIAPLSFGPPAPFLMTALRQTRSLNHFGTKETTPLPPKADSAPSVLLTTHPKREQVLQASRLMGRELPLSVPGNKFSGFFLTWMQRPAANEAAVASPETSSLIVATTSEGKVIGAARLSPLGKAVADRLMDPPADFSPDAVQGKVACLDDVVVDAAHRRQGVGGQLVEEAITQAHDKHYEQLVLEAAHPQAASLYRQKGFVPLGRAGMDALLGSLPAEAKTQLTQHDNWMKTDLAPSHPTQPKTPDSDSSPSLHREKKPLNQLA